MDCKVSKLCFAGAGKGAFQPLPFILSTFAVDVSEQLHVIDWELAGYMVEIIDIAIHLSRDADFRMRSVFVSYAICIFLVIYCSGYC